MKRKKSIVVSLVALLLLALSACSTKSPAGNDPEQPTPVVTEAPTPTTVPPSPTPSPTPVPVFSTERFSSEEVAASGVYSVKDLPFTPEKMKRSDSELILLQTLYSENAVAFCRLDLMTGQYTNKEVSVSEIDLSFSDTFFDFSVNGAFLILYEENEGNFFLLNRDFEVVDTVKLSCLHYYTVTQLPDGSLIYRDSGSEAFTLISAGEDGKLSVKELTFALPDNYQVYIIHSAPSTDTLLMTVKILEDDYDYDSLEWTNSREKTILYNLTTGDFTELWIDSSTYLICNQEELIGVSYSDQKVQVFSPDTPNQIRNFSYEKDTTVYETPLHSNLFFYNDDFEDKVFRLFGYELATGNLSVTTVIPYEGEYSYLCSATFFEDTYFLLLNLGEENLLCYWTPVPSITEPAYTYLQQPIASVENDNLIGQIYSEYGISVLIRESAIIYNADYFTVAEFDEKKINRALTILYQTLSMFPKDFFREVCDSSSFQQIRIHLTGTIRKNPYSENTLTTAGGFVTEEGNARLMTVDINDYGLDRTFPHEFMHIIEGAIYSKGYATSDPTFEGLKRFTLMNPRDFSYGYSYSDTDKNYRYSDYCGSNFFSTDPDFIPQGVYFVDEYSITYPTEDIARIFETLATRTPESAPKYIYSLTFQQKAAYLCFCIREAFDCITDDTVLPWESLLLDRYSKEYFSTTYPMDEDPLG